MPVGAGIDGQNRSIEKVECRLWGGGAEVISPCSLDEESAF